MEEHPVPHNVLDIEFKLFGSFSPRQFFKLIAGCVVGFIIYTLQLPGVVSLPLILAAVGYGIGSAMIPKFDSKASTVMGVILISPRYVWRRTNKTPAVLESTPAAVAPRTTTTSTQSVNVNSQAIEDIIATRAARRQSNAVNSQSNEVSATKSDQEYSEFFGSDRPSTAFTSTYSNMFEGATTSQPVDTPVVSKPNTPTPQVAEPTLQELNTELLALQGQFNKLQKERSEPQVLQDLAKRIDEIHKQIQEFRQPQVAAPSALHIYGLVVDKKGNPLPNAVVNIFTNAAKLVAAYKTNEDGRFHTTQELALGHYNVRVELSGYKFSSYDVIVSGDKLPAYRFKAE